MKLEEMWKAEPGQQVFFTHACHWKDELDGSVVDTQPVFYNDTTLAFTNKMGVKGGAHHSHILCVYTFGNRHSPAIMEVINNAWPLRLFCILEDKGIRVGGRFIRMFQDYMDEKTFVDQEFEVKQMLASWLIHMDEEDLDLFINEK